MSNLLFLLLVPGSLGCGSPSGPASDTINPDVAEVIGPFNPGDPQESGTVDFLVAVVESQVAYINIATVDSPLSDARGQIAHAMPMYTRACLERAGVMGQPIVAEQCDVGNLCQRGSPFCDSDNDGIPIASFGSAVAFGCNYFVGAEEFEILSGVLVEDLAESSNSYDFEVYLPNATISNEVGDTPGAMTCQLQLFENLVVGSQPGPNSYALDVEEELTWTDPTGEVLNLKTTDLHLDYVTNESWDWQSGALPADGGITGSATWNGTRFGEPFVASMTVTDPLRVNPSCHNTDVVSYMSALEGGTMEIRYEDRCTQVTYTSCGVADYRACKD